MAKKALKFNAKKSFSIEQTYKYAKICLILLLQTICNQIFKETSIITSNGSNCFYLNEDNNVYK